MGQILEPLLSGEGKSRCMCLHRTSLGGATRWNCDEAAFDVSRASFVMHPQYLLSFPVGFPLSLLLLLYVPVRSSWVLLSQALFSGEPGLGQSSSHSCQCSSCGVIKRGFHCKDGIGLRFESRRAVSGKVQFILQGR